MRSSPFSIREWVAELFMAALILTEVAARRVFNTVVVPLDSRRMEDMKARRQRVQEDA